MRLDLKQTRDVLSFSSIVHARPNGRNLTAGSVVIVNQIFGFAVNGLLLRVPQKFLKILAADAAGMFTLQRSGGGTNGRFNRVFLSLRC